MWDAILIGPPSFSKHVGSSTQWGRPEFWKSSNIENRRFYQLAQILKKIRILRIKQSSAVLERWSTQPEFRESQPKFWETARILKKVEFWVSLYYLEIRMMFTCSMSISCSLYWHYYLPIFDIDYVAIEPCVGDTHDCKTT